MELTEEFMHSLDAALDHPNAPERHVFMANDLFPIVDYIRDNWASLLPSRSNPFRRTLVGTYPIGQDAARFYYSVRAELRPDGVIRVENISIDWDYRPLGEPEE